MAVRGFDEGEEKKSYGSVFLLGTSLLVVVTLWSLWDDNITRRPWKKYQTEFYRLDYRKAKAAYDEEDKKLQADPAYQELAKKLAAEEASLNGGDLAKKLKALKGEEIKANVRFSEIDQEVKFIKSELEEAWYDTTTPSSREETPSPIWRPSGSWTRKRPSSTRHSKPRGKKESRAKRRSKSSTPASKSWRASSQR